MKSIEIYTTPTCGYCHAAKRLLNKKGVEYTEIDVSMDPELRRKMMERSDGGWTVPQIFFDGSLIGGCDDLFDLEADGVLDAMIAA